LSNDHLFEGIKAHDPSMLSAAITLVESLNPDHREQADELLKLCLPLSGNSVRVGITGVPGVGKSTFIESFGKLLIERGKRVAVLAIDPSSAVSGGSILGDKTRMQELSTMKEVFIRPSPAGTTLGGVARKTRESIILCESAGFDFILIETVGVGQSETVVNSMVDFFLLLMLSGAGDELQGIKKGIMEMADALVITKADGDNEKKAKQASVEYKNAMHLFPPNDNEWIPQVFTCSALENTNIDKVVDVIDSFCQQTKLNGSFDQNRHEQDKVWLKETVKEYILQEFFNNEVYKGMMKDLEERVLKGELTSFQAADIILKKYRNED
jgi:LAO/AO transport system kinase